jgi:hypothetical protein
MTLGNMRELGVHHLIACGLNNVCRGSALIDVSGYPDVIEVPKFGKRAKCAASAWTCSGIRTGVLDAIISREISHTTR